MAPSRRNSVSIVLNKWLIAPKKNPLLPDKEVSKEYKPFSHHQRLVCSWVPTQAVEHKKVAFISFWDVYIMRPSSNKAIRSQVALESHFKTAQTLKHSSVD